MFWVRRLPCLHKLIVRHAGHGIVDLSCERNGPRLLGNEVGNVLSHRLLVRRLAGQLLEFASFPFTDDPFVDFSGSGSLLLHAGFPCSLRSRNELRPCVNSVDRLVAGVDPRPASLLLNGRWGLYPCSGDLR